MKYIPKAKDSTLLFHNRVILGSDTNVNVFFLSEVGALVSYKPIILHFLTKRNAKNVWDNVGFKHLEL